MDPSIPPPSTTFPANLPLLPTAVIGSLPRPTWLLDVLQDYLAGRISGVEWNKACDQAIPSAIALQETAGIDILTDGEWRREGYFQVFYERVHGFQPDLIAGRTRRWPAAVGPLQREQPIVADGVAFLRRQTKRAIKVTLPSAYVILRRFYSPEHSVQAYPTREHFLNAVEAVLLEEAGDVIAAGADCLQFDDPMLGYFVDPKYREQRSGHWGTGQFADAEAELQLGVASVSRLGRELRQRGTYVVLHVCRGNIERRSDAQGDYRAIWDALCAAEVDELALEFAMPKAGSLEVLAAVPTGLRIGLGCLDVRCPEPERPETIAARIHKALQYLPAARLTLNPDCGFAPSGTNPLPLDEAYLKLKALAQAASHLRSGLRQDSGISPSPSTTDPRR
jgi:5-methyltetrahydropteroyltriglutamate--homocysteine methyltransferase